MKRLTPPAHQIARRGCIRERDSQGNLQLTKACPKHKPQS